MSPFTPAGDHARWRTLYDLLCEREIGEVLTYEEMGEALGLDAKRDRQVMQLAMRRAIRELEVNNSRTTDAVTNIGYRIIEPAEHLSLARRHQGKAKRSVVRAHNKVESADRNLIRDPAVVRALEVAAHILADQQEMMKRMDLRQGNLEKAVASVAQKTERNEDELVELRERLARLEAKTLGE